MFSRNFLFLVSGIILGATSFAAFDVPPIIMSVAPSGKEATVTLTVTNTGDSKAPIQISVFKREPDINGIEKYEESNEVGDSFQIIPSQFIINPREKRSVRITYVGEPRLTSEQSYRVIAEEFPIDVSDPDRVKSKAVAAISILSKYVTSLYVKPMGVIADVSIEASQSKDNKMVLVFKNKGSEHKILKNTRYKVVTLSDKREFPLPYESEVAIGAQNILAGKSRKFVIPWPKGIPTVPLRVSIENQVKK